MSKYIFSLLAFFYGTSILNLTGAENQFYETTIRSLGGVERLYCSNVTNNDTNINLYQPLAWMLPNLTVIYGNTSDNKFIFEDDTWTLAIDSVAQDDLGLYHCMMDTTESQWFLVKLGLNARGPFFEDLWNTYELNTIIGLCAAAGFMLLVAAIYLLCRAKPSWFYACNNGGARVDPYDEDDDVGSDSSDDLEKKIGASEKGSVKEEEKEEKVKTDENKKTQEDAGETSEQKDGVSNPAFSDSEHL